MGPSASILNRTHTPKQEASPGFLFHPDLDLELTPFYAPFALYCRLRRQLRELGFKEPDLDKCEAACGGLQSMPGSLD